MSDFYLIVPPFRASPHFLVEMAHLHYTFSGVLKGKNSKYRVSCLLLSVWPRICTHHLCSHLAGKVSLRPMATFICTGG